MAVNWDLYNKRLNINGSTTRERDLNYIKQNINDKLPNSLSYKSVLINDVPQNIEILKSNNTSKNTTKKQINSLPNETFSCGDYVKYKNATYLIIDVDVDDEVYTTGRIELCNWILKFQSPTGTILSYPCIDDSSLTTGLDENKIITTLSGIHRIKLPFDDNTKLIGVDRRFFLDKVGTTTYKVTNVNNTTYNYGDKGLIELTLQQDMLQINDGELPKDRPDLGICNYFEPTTEPKPPVEGYSYAVITCSNPNNEITLGSSTYRMLVPTFYNADATLASGITAVWNWELPNGYESYFDIKYDGNLAKIKVLENYDLLGTTVKGNVMSSNGGYGGSITLTIIV